jgi:hypothetical protein
MRVRLPVLRDFSRNAKQDSRANRVSGGACTTQCPKRAKRNAEMLKFQRFYFAPHQKQDKKTRLLRLDSLQYGGRTFQIDCSSQIVGKKTETELRGRFLYPFAKYIVSAVEPFHRAEGVFGDTKSRFLFRNLFFGRPLDILNSKLVKNEIAYCDKIKNSIKLKRKLNNHR